MGLTQQKEYEDNKAYRFKEYYEDFTGTYFLDKSNGKAFEKELEKSIAEELKKLLKWTKSIETLVIWPGSGKLEIPLLEVMCSRLKGKRFKICLIEPNQELAGQFEYRLKQVAKRLKNKFFPVKRLALKKNLPIIESVDSRFHIILAFSVFPHFNEKGQLNLINDLDNYLVDGGLILWAENNDWLRAVEGSLDYSERLYLEEKRKNSEEKKKDLKEKWKEFWKEFHDRVFEKGKININPIKDSDHSLVEFIYRNNGYQKIFQGEISIDLKKGPGQDGLTIKNWIDKENSRYVNPSLTDDEFKEKIFQDSVNALTEAINEASNNKEPLIDNIKIFSFKKQIPKYSEGTKENRILDNPELKSLISYHFQNNLLLRFLRKEVVSSSRLFEELNIGTKFHSPDYDKIVLKRRLYVLTKYLFKLIGKAIHMDYALWASPSGDTQREITPRSLPISFLHSKGKKYEKTYIGWYGLYFFSRKCLNIGETFGDFLFRNMPDYESIVIKKVTGTGKKLSIQEIKNKNILEIEQIGMEINAIFRDENHERQINENELIEMVGSEFNETTDGMYQFDSVFKILKKQDLKLDRLSEKIKELYTNWRKQVDDNGEAIRKLREILEGFRMRAKLKFKKAEITNLTDEFLKHIFTTNFINGGEWGSIRFKLNSIFKKEKEQPYEGFLLLSNVNSQDLEKKEIEIIDFLIDDAATQFTAKDAFYTSYCLLKRDVSINALRSAIAAIMSRNMSHNIGSHVIADLVAKTPIANKDDLNSLYRYLQNRMDFIAQITAEIPQWTYPAHFHKGIMRIFYENVLLIDRIGISEGLKSYDWGEGGVQKDKIIVRTGLSRRRLQEKEVNEDNFEWVVSENQDEENHDEKIKKDLPLAIPGGMLGYHAFYIIIENILRNSAKHGYVGSRPHLPDPDSCLVVKVRIDDMLDKDYAWITIWDNIQQRAKRVFNLEVEKKNREVSGDITEDEIENPLNETEQMNLFGSLNHRFRRPFIKSEGDLVKENWGLAELKICAGYLQNRQPEEIGDYRGRIIDYGTDCFNLKKEFTIDDLENLNRGYPAMIIKAIPVDESGDEIKELKKGNMKEDNIYFLGYRFWMKKPKIVAVVGDIQEEKHRIKIGPVCIKGVNSPEDLRKYGIYHLGSDLDELIINKQSLDFEFLVIYVRDTKKGGLFMEAIRRIPQPRGSLSENLKRSLNKEFGVEHLESEGKEEKQERQASQTRQEEKIFKWLSRVIEHLPARIIIIGPNPVEKNWNFPENDIQKWMCKRIVWINELENVHIQEKEGNLKDYKVPDEVKYPDNKEPGILVLEPEQLAPVLYNTWIRNHYWKGEFEVDINFVGDSETAHITIDYIIENMWQILDNLKTKLNVEIDCKTLFLPFYCPEDAMPGKNGWIKKCVELLDIKEPKENKENMTPLKYNDYLLLCSNIIRKRHRLPYESVFEIKEVLYEIFNKKSLSKVPEIFRSVLPQGNDKKKFIIKQTYDEKPIKIKYSRHDTLKPENIMEHQADDPINNNKYFYQESLTGAAPHFNLLYSTFTTGNAVNQAEMYFNLVENGLMRMLIADERISNYVEKEQKMKDTFLCAGITVIEDIEAFIANCANNNNDFLKKILPKKEKENEKDSTIDKRRFDLFIIHQGVIDKMKLQPGQVEDLINEWKKNYFSFVIVTSGRGTPSNVPINTRFLPFSILESSFITPAISKFIAGKSAYKSLARRN